VFALVSVFGFMRLGGSFVSPGGCFALSLLPLLVGYRLVPGLLVHAPLRLPTKCLCFFCWVLVLFSPFTLCPRLLCDRTAFLFLFNAFSNV